MTVVTVVTMLSHVIAVYVHRMSVHKDCEPVACDQRAPIALRQAVVIAVDVIVFVVAVYSDRCRSRPLGNVSNGYTTVFGHCYHSSHLVITPPQALSSHLVSGTTWQPHC